MYAKVSALWIIELDYDKLILLFSKLKGYTRFSYKTLIQTFGIKLYHLVNRLW